MEKEKLINIKSNWKHSTQEYLIKKLDPSQDMSRSAVFEREVRAAEHVKDWKLIQTLLSELDRVEDAPVFTNLQARYSEETEKKLNKIREKILEDLKTTGLKVLQTQYLVLLLQANYLATLKEERLTITAETQVDEENIDMPEMAKIFCEMMLSDKNCEEIKKIRKILAEWRNK